jgi:hypothetical protein
MSKNQLNYEQLYRLLKNGQQALKIFMLKHLLIKQLNKSQNQTLTGEKKNEKL